MPGPLLIVYSAVRFFQYTIPPRMIWHISQSAEYRFNESIRVLLSFVLYRSIVVRTSSSPLGSCKLSTSHRFPILRITVEPLRNRIYYRQASILNCLCCSVCISAKRIRRNNRWMANYTDIIRSLQDAGRIIRIICYRPSPLRIMQESSPLVHLRPLPCPAAPQVVRNTARGTRMSNTHCASCG
jgi:hypothetical protein